MVKDLELKRALVLCVSQLVGLTSRLLPTLRPKKPGGDKEKSRIRPLIRKDYPLSLSISLSGGEETNQDFPSNGERTGKSPA